MFDTVAANKSGKKGCYTCPRMCGALRDADGTTGFCGVKGMSVTF